MTEEHATPIKSPKQLLIVVALAFLIPITLIVLLSQLVTGGATGLNTDDHAVLARIAPVARVAIAENTGPKGLLTGEQVYGQVCKTCHETGLAGAHKFGDSAAWAKVVAQGPDTTFQHALAGIRAMPARGGNADLTDDEVKRGVVYMVNRAGASWKEPPPTAQTALAAATERTGQQVVEASCGKCHATGEGGAPRIGDRAAWIQRLKLGLQPVYQSALKGHSGMPARGGMADLSDAEVKRAVEYMMNSGAATAVVAAAPVAAPAPAAASAAVDGKKIYDGVCVVCHAAGVAGAPKLGDRAAWAPRLKTGMEALYAAALKGKNAMPAKGGNAALSDADVKAAVDFMTAAAK